MHFHSLSLRPPPSPFVPMCPLHRPPHDTDAKQEGDGLKEVGDDVRHGYGLFPVATMNEVTRPVVTR